MHSHTYFELHVRWRLCEKLVQNCRKQLDVAGGRTTRFGAADRLAGEQTYFCDTQLGIKLVEGKREISLWFNA